MLSVTPASSVNASAAATDGTSFFFGSSANGNSIIYTLPVSSINASVVDLTAGPQVPGHDGGPLIRRRGRQVCGILAGGSSPNVIRCGLGGGEDMPGQQPWTLSPLNGATFINFIFYSQSIIASQSDGRVIVFPNAEEPPLVVATSQAMPTTIFGALPGPAAGTTVIYWDSSGGLSYAVVPALP